MPWDSIENQWTFGHAQIKHGNASLVDILIGVIRMGWVCCEVNITAPCQVILYTIGAPCVVTARVSVNALIVK